MANRCRHKRQEMVLLGRIELPTSALPRMRSTTELQQHTISCEMPDAARGALGAGAPFGGGGRVCQAGLARGGGIGHSTRMTNKVPDEKADRQARLAEQLRANLRRRKAQARALVAAGDAAAAPKTDLPKS